MGLISGTEVELIARPCDENSTLVLILGAAGAVGQFSVQVAKLCNLRALASCSSSNDEFVKRTSADATFDYKLPLAEQLNEIGRVTAGNFSKVFDCSAMAAETGLAALTKSTGTEPRIFATNNDWQF